MWLAFKHVKTGIVHAVSLPRGMSPHGYALDWPLVKTDAPLSCHLCLQFAFGGRFQDARLHALLPADFCESKTERRCLLCNAPVSRCCC